MPRGSRAIGDFFKLVRHECGYEGDKIYAFAAQLPMTGQALQRIETGERLPGAKVLALIHPWIVEAELDPMHLMYLWLEAHGLKEYVADIKARSRRR